LPALQAPMAAPAGGGGGLDRSAPGRTAGARLLRLPLQRKGRAPVLRAGLRLPRQLDLGSHGHHPGPAFGPLGAGLAAPAPQRKKATGVAFPQAINVNSREPCGPITLPRRRTVPWTGTVHRYRAAPPR